jgi:hypothetical protein
MKELAKILDRQRDGKSMPLIIGDHVYGLYRWVITGTNKVLEVFDADGRLVSVKVTVTLLADGKR